MTAAAPERYAIRTAYLQPADEQSLPDFLTRHERWFSSGRSSSGEGAAAGEDWIARGGGSRGSEGGYLSYAAPPLLQDIVSARWPVRFTSLLLKSRPSARQVVHSATRLLTRSAPPEQNNQLLESCLPHQEIGRLLLFWEVGLVVGGAPAN